MSRHHPQPAAEIPVSRDIHLKLIGASIHTGFEKEDWEIAAEAIDEWVRRHDPDVIPMPATKGYQWKSLFLPDGTLLRTVFGGTNHHCLVEDDRIVYLGHAVSPSGFVNAVGGIRRSTWRSTWILLPDTNQWQLADSLRTRARPPRPRKPARVIEQATPMQAAAPAPANAAPASGPGAGPVPGSDSRFGPLPAHVELDAASGSEQRCRQANHDTARQSCADAEGHGGPPHAGAAFPSLQCRRGVDRRASGDERVPPVLREELLSLLNRMVAINGKRQERRGRPSGGSSPN